MVLLWSNRPVEAVVVEAVAIVCLALSMFWIAGTARLIVGADPWGEVALDGAPLGRAPGAWTVPAGPHDVEVVFPGDPPQRQRFHVDLAPGGSEQLFAPFKP